MAATRVTALRDSARSAMLAAGGRGFVRFAPPGDALLLTDAPARCPDGGAALKAALAEAGFSCRLEGPLAYLTPEDALLASLCARDGAVTVDWDSPLHPAQALAARLLRGEERPVLHAALTPSGRALLLEMARLLWRPRAQVLAGLGAIRAQAAALLRQQDRGGLPLAGGMLANWCEQECEKERMIL